MSASGANDPMVSLNYTLWSGISPRGIRWEFINGSPLMFGKLKRTFFA